MAVRTQPASRRAQPIHDRRRVWFHDQRDLHALMLTSERDAACWCKGGAVSVARHVMVGRHPMDAPMRSHDRMIRKLVKRREENS